MHSGCRWIADRDHLHTGDSILILFIVSSTPQKLFNPIESYLLSLAIAPMAIRVQLTKLCPMAISWSVSPSRFKHSDVMLASWSIWVGYFIGREKGIYIVFSVWLSSAQNICQRGCHFSRVWFFYTFVKIRWLWLCDFVCGSSLCCTDLYICFPTSD